MRNTRARGIRKTPQISNASRTRVAAIRRSYTTNATFGLRTSDASAGKKTGPQGSRCRAAGAPLNSGDKSRGDGGDDDGDNADIGAPRRYVAHSGDTRDGGDDGCDTAPVAHSRRGFQPGPVHRPPAEALPRSGSVRVIP